MKRLFYGAVALAVILAACDTVEDVYDDIDTRQPRGIAIANGGDLAKIGVDADYPLNGDYYLADDIDLSAHSPWAPIGTEAAPFSGILDGNGKTIRGLTLNGGSRVHTGLFGYLLAARLTNLTIEINSSTVVLTATTAQYAGVAAGYAKSSYINGITIQGTANLYAIKVGGAATIVFSAGGLAGRLEESTVTNITVSLNLQAVSSTTLNAGLVTGESAGGTLASCFAEGTVDVAGGSTTVNAGGMVGTLTSTMEKCVSAVSKVYAESSGANAVLSVGGIAGKTTVSSPVVGNVFSSSLKAGYPVVIQGLAKSTGTVNAGGISGNSSGTVNPAFVTINKCVVDAPEVHIIAEAEGAANLYAGGIAGQSGIISNSSIRRGEVLAKTASVAATNLVIAAGGISGMIPGTQGKNISNCFSAANVTVDSAHKAVLANANAATAAGGVAGVLAAGTQVEGSGASGTVRIVSTNSDSSSTFVFASGLVGHGRYGSISIKQSAALNESVTVESQAAAAYVYRILGGALAANNNTTLVEPDAVPTAANTDLYRNYALRDMTVQTKLGADEWVDVPQELNDTANLMGSGNIERSQALFETRLGWNFNTDWEWDAAADLPFPRIN